MRRLMSLVGGPGTRTSVCARSLSESRTLGGVGAHEPARRILAGTSAVLGAMTLHSAFLRLETAAGYCDRNAAMEITSQIPAMLDRAQQVIRASLGSAA